MRERRVWDEGALAASGPWAALTERGVELAQGAGGHLDSALGAKLSVWGLSSLDGSGPAGGDTGSRGRPSRLDGDGDKEEEAMPGLFYV